MSRPLSCIGFRLSYFIIFVSLLKKFIHDSEIENNCLFGLFIEVSNIYMQKIKGCNNDEAQDVERMLSRGGYDQALPNFYQSTWPF